MTQTQATVRRHVVVDTAIDRAFSVFTERFGDSSRPSTTSSMPQSPRPCLSLRWGATSSTEPSRYRVPVGAHPR